MIAELTDAFEEICKSKCVLKSFEVSELKEGYPKDKCFSPPTSEWVGIYRGEITQVEVKEVEQN